MPTPLKRGRGRPALGRVGIRCFFLPEEIVKLDRLRSKKARGVYLGELIAKQPLNPFSAFATLARRA